MSVVNVRRFTALVLGSGALLASACVAPFPGAGAAVTWIDSPGPATFELAVDDGIVTRYDLAELTEPQYMSCDVGLGVPGPMDLFCESYYQGTGFAIAVPSVCQEAIRHTEAPATVPKMQLDVDGATQQIEPFALPGTPWASWGVRSALYVTVSGPGILTTGANATALGSGETMRAKEIPTLHVAEKDSYEVRISCADGPGAEPGTWSITTYTTTVTRP